MGTDIAGGVEIRPHGPASPWLLADVDLDDLPRHYDAFGLLFGVRNYAGFDPVAPGRGLPGDASPELRKLQLTDDEHDHTWVTWTELSRIDWDAPAPRVDDRIHKYEGTRFVGKSGFGADWQAVAGESADPRGSSYPEGTEWRSGDRIWRVERLTQSDVLRTDPQLATLFDTMRNLANQHGPDNVRLVVWFDS
ncbi:hypothetical protein M1L60_14435 [Actinoplanes sp. TRM 88003]|uniref:Uncharacterized protein n=1 Tax=Paractinoplanes aksuensis TaxID=2939490 RepID=A0ABT1DLT2_9ACTN|nr:hypothetical protein [Actinoplanes aksuensis]MCO8271792.1 hypothetical protein [Actinoplanes aksuensis]